MNFKYFIFFTTLSSFQCNSIELHKKQINKFTLYEPLGAGTNDFIFNLKKLYNPHLNVNVKLGENLMINCVTDYINPQKETYWFKIDRNADLKITYLNESRLENRIVFEKSFLSIENFQEYDTGIYFCLTDNHFQNFKKEKEPEKLVSFLNVSRIEYFLFEYQEFKTVEMISQDKSFQGLINYDYDTGIDFEDRESGLRVFTVWDEWSPCSGACNKSVNMRTRRGHCFVNLSETSSNKFLQRIQQAYLSTGGWSCYLNIHFEFLPFSSSLMQIFKDFIEYSRCDVDCVKYEQDQLDADVIYF